MLNFFKYHVGGVKYYWRRGSVKVFSIAARISRSLDARLTWGPFEVGLLAEYYAMNYTTKYFSWIARNLSIMTDSEEGIIK